MVANLSLTLRERLGGRRLQRHALAAVVTIAVFAYLGPFGTAIRLGPGELIAYWGVNIGANWAIGLGVVPRVTRTLERNGMPVWAGVAFGALASAVPGTAIVAAVEWWFSRTSISWAFAIYLYSCVAVVYLVLTCLARQMIELPLRQQPDTGKNGEDAEPSSAHHQTPVVPFLFRLSPHLGRDLHHLHMQDHYVEVHTGKGSELVLLRFRDALREVEGLDGLQVHRSHWVARSAVARSYRRNGRVFLELSNGSEVPVSRTFVSVLAENGWL